MSDQVELENDVKKKKKDLKWEKEREEYLQKMSQKDVKSHHSAYSHEITWMIEEVFLVSLSSKG